MYQQTPGTTNLPGRRIITLSKAPILALTFDPHLAHHSCRPLETLLHCNHMCHITLDIYKLFFLLKGAFTCGGIHSLDKSAVQFNIILHDIDNSYHYC